MYLDIEAASESVNQTVRNRAKLFNQLFKHEACMKSMRSLQTDKTVGKDGGTSLNLFDIHTDVHSKIH
jgi:hypothetical protein